MEQGTDWIVRLLGGLYNAVGEYWDTLFSYWHAFSRSLSICGKMRPKRIEGLNFVASCWHMADEMIWRDKVAV